MPIKIADDLPARRILEAEGIAVMRESDAVRQDIRPLRVGLLNLMPDKITTETQLARLLGATPLQIELTLVRITDHFARNTGADHMASFYRPWSALAQERFDGLVITGAPVEHLPFEEVSYWPELCAIFEWTQTHVHHTMTICWAAQAALYHAHGIPKCVLETKAFGICTHHVLAPSSPYVRGFSDLFDVPVSRWAASCEDRLSSHPVLKILATSQESGACLVADDERRTLHMFNHLEYDTDTLAGEFHRDDSRQLPLRYFPGDDPANAPRNSWRGHGHLLFANWVNEIYRTTPFNLTAVGSSATPD